MINKVRGIHPRDETYDYSKCISASGYYLDGSTMGVLFYHDDTGKSHIFLYDLSNLIEGIKYVQKTFPEHVLPIDSLLLENGLLTIKWKPCNPYTTHENHSVDKDGILYMGGSTNIFTDPKRPEPTATIIFPPVETNEEWQDRMHRTLAHCAHQFEKAVSEITPQLYTHSDAYHSANLSAEMVDRVANTGMHARLNIGYLWHQVLAAVSPLEYPRPSRISVETNVFRVFQNMKTPEHIKAFFHNHNREEWKKLRHQSSDDRHNHRRIHIWDTDYTAGKLLLDINEKNTTNGVLQELDAKAEFHTCATADYKLAASSPNWELVTERVY